MNPLESTKGKIIRVDEDGTVLIRASLPDLNRYLTRGYQEVYIEYIDSRPLSVKQRRMCWAMIGEIAEWMGQSRNATARDLTNESRKVDFLVNEIGENADRLFSLSNAPISLVAAYQRYLVHFIVENEVPTKVPMLDYVDDIADYVYCCLIHKQCVITGQPAQLHHIDRVGMGRDRHDIVHEGMEVIPLSPEMHDKIHVVGDRAFLADYHIDAGIKLDKTLCRIYHLKASKE